MLLFLLFSLHLHVFASRSRLEKIAFLRTGEKRGREIYETCLEFIALHIFDSYSLNKPEQNV